MSLATTPMAPISPSYDVIVLGGGVNGLSLAINLAAAGVKTLIVERAMDVGGQAATHEGLRPGFCVHPHANYLSFQDILASRQERSCKAMLVPTITPLAQHGLCFRDGRPPVIIYRRDCIAKTRLSFSQYSGRDARTFERLKSRADQLTPHISALYFSPPHLLSYRKFLRQTKGLFGGLIDPSTFGHLSAHELIDQLFESDEVRTLLYLVAAEFSGDISEPGGDAGFLGYVLWVIGRRQLPIGGMGSVARSLQSAAVRAGAHMLFGVAAARVLVKSNAACGVLLEDGRAIMSSVVASSIDFLETIAMSIDRLDLTSAERQELSRFEQASPNAIGSYAGCLDDSPRYKSGFHNSDINKCAQTFVGADSTQEVLAREHDLRAGQLPMPSGAIRVNSLWDPQQAPPHQHIAGADCPFPSSLSPSDRLAIEHVYPEAFVQMWAEYAPNVSRSVLEQVINVTELGNRRILLREGEAQYRGSITGLYLCGATTHPGGGVHGACGANAYGVLMQDRAQMRGHKVQRN